MVDARVLHRLLLLLIVIGLFFAIYATAEVTDPALRNYCSPNPFLSCSKVDDSNHTTLGPVPDWSVGLAGFVILLLLDIQFLRTFERRYHQLLLVFSGIGVAVTAVLAYVELGIIGALCPICLGCYLANLGVFAVLILLWRLRQQGEAEERAVKAAAAGTTGAAKAD